MAEDNVLELNDQNFDDETASGVVLVDFWAPWCGPCRMQGPIVERVADEVSGKAKVAKLNVDDSPQTAARFSIRSIPTILVMKDGEVAQQFVGVRQQAELVKSIESALSA